MHTAEKKNKIICKSDSASPMGLSDTKTLAESTVKYTNDKKANKYTLKSELRIDQPKGRAQIVKNLIEVEKAYFEPTISLND